MARRTVFIAEDVDVVRTSVIREMLDEGSTIAQIAAKCNVTPQTIHYQLRQMGLRYSRTKGWQNGGGA